MGQIEQGKQTRANMMRFIREYFRIHGYAPSYREIGEGCGLSSLSTIKSHMQRLIIEGYLETDAEPGSPRAFRVARGRRR